VQQLNSLERKRKVRGNILMNKYFIAILLARDSI